jgi:hypothetical protein
LIGRADAEKGGKLRGATRSRQLLALCARSTSTYCAAHNVATHAVRLLPLRSWLAQPTLSSGAACRLVCWLGRFSVIFSAGVIAGGCFCVCGFCCYSGRLNISGRVIAGAGCRDLCFSVLSLVASPACRAPYGEGPGEPKARCL